MSDRYVVHVAAPAEGEEESVAARLADVLGFEPKKIDSILRRLPDVVTKPVPKAEAEKVAGRFQQAGLSALVLPAGSSEKRRASDEQVRPDGGAGHSPTHASAFTPDSQREPADPPPAASSAAMNEAQEAGQPSGAVGNADAPAEVARGRMADPSRPSEPETAEEFTYRQTTASLTGVSVDAAEDETHYPPSSDGPDEAAESTGSSATADEGDGRERRSGWMVPLLLLVAVALAVLAYLYLLD